MSFPELRAEYRFKKGIEFSREGPYFLKAAKNYLASCLHSEDLTFTQRQEARETLEKSRPNFKSRLAQ
jgi:hypothetical protein